MFDKDTTALNHQIETQKRLLSSDNHKAHIRVSIREAFIKKNIIIDIRQ